MANHEKDLRAVLNVLRENKLVVDPKKANVIMREVEFCGYVLREGRRSPAPGKLLSIQKWELPRTITQLRGFLGFTNYSSCYIKKYSTLASPFMSHLQVGRVDGKKGSQNPIKWTEKGVKAFGT
jgi:hypothetical protein